MTTQVTQIYICCLKIITVLSENCVWKNNVNKVHIKQNKYKILSVVY